MVLHLVVYRQAAAVLSFSKKISLQIQDIINFQATLMDYTGSDDREKILSVKAAINMYGNRNETMGRVASVRKTHNNLSEKSSSRMRDLHALRRNIGEYKDSIKTAEQEKTKAESELSGAKKKVKDLCLMIEESNLRVESEKEDMEVLQTARKQRMKTPGENGDKFCYEPVLAELELVKQELSRVKLDIASTIEDKTRAEKEIAESSSKMIVFASPADSLRKEIEEVNEELVLVELARIEALKEFGDIDARRKKEANEFSLRLEKTRREMHEIIEEVQKSREYESKLAATLADVNVLQNELILIREMESKSFQRKENLIPVRVTESGESEESEAPVLLETVNEELEAAKNELSATREIGFQYMRSMDVARNELLDVKSKISLLEKIEKKNDLSVANLNSKLLRAKSKLESVSANEEKAQSLLNSLTLTLEKLNAQRDTANREKDEIRKEVEAMKAEIRKTESEIDKTEASLEVGMQELEAVKITENRALEKLKTLVENTMRVRESAGHRSQSMTISKFEYEYLTNHAAAAKEVADKKIAAAQAWVEALKESETEIQINTNIAQKQMKGMGMEEAKVSVAKEGDLEQWEQKCEEEAEEFSRRTSTSRIRKGKGNWTPPRRPKFRKSASPAGRNASSFPMKRKRVIPNWTHFFSGRRITRDM